MTTMTMSPRTSVPLDPESVELGHEWSRDLTTVIEWGLYVDEEFGMTPRERNLWRLLVVVRDTLADLGDRGSRPAVGPVGPRPL